MTELGYAVGQATEEDSQVLGTLVGAAREAVDYWRGMALERQAVIDGLDAACRERQELINRLDAECRERQAVIDQLDAECRRQREATASLHSGSCGPLPESI